MHDLLLRVPCWMRRPLAILAGLAAAIGVSEAVVPDGLGFWVSFFTGFAIGAVLTFPALYLGWRWERMEEDR